MIFTKALHIQADDAGCCETLIRTVHASRPQYSYTDVLNACIEMCSRHPEPSRVTLKSLSLGNTWLTQQFEEIIRESQS